MKIFLPLPLEEIDHILDAEIGDPHYFSPELAISDIEGFEGPYIIEIWERTVDHEADTYSTLADVRYCFSPRFLNQRLVGQNSDGSYLFTGPQTEILEEQDYMAELDDLDHEDLDEQMELGLINAREDLEIDVDDIELLTHYLLYLLVGKSIVCRKASELTSLNSNREKSLESIKYESEYQEITPPFDRTRLQILVETTKGWIELALIEFETARLYRQFQLGFRKTTRKYFLQLVKRGSLES